MKEILFNVPLYFNKSSNNVKNFLNSKKPLHGPGSNLKKIRKILKKIFSFQHTYLTNSCTSALEICALSMELKPTDEILVPSFAFITTASSFARTGCRIKYLDIDQKNLMPNFFEIKKKITKKTKAIVLIHYQGYSVDYLEELKNLCKRKKILFVEDAAQAFGSYYKNKPLGSFGDFACFSFHETKNIHSGTGGLLVVNNKKFLNKVNSIFDKGTNRYLMEKKKVKYYSWVNIGSSFLMNEFNASYLLPQIINYKNIFFKRSLLFNQYYKNLTILNGRKIFFTNHFKYRYNYHAFVIILKKNIREKFLRYLKKNGINAVISYTPLHKSHFGKKFLIQYENLIKTEYCTKRIVRLPLHNSLTIQNVNYITSKILNFFK